MTQQHKISWLNMPGYKPETWNPIIGCSKVSPGCDNCYAERMANRLAGIAGNIEYASVIQSDSNKWNGKTTLVDNALTKPLLWKTPRMVFVCSMADLFHESVPFEWINAVFSVMSDLDQHIYVILTKRPERMLEFYDWKCNQHQAEWRPKDNIWIGVTAENQEQFNKRIFYLLKVPAAKRFVSIEPMLGPVDLWKIFPVNSEIHEMNSLLRNPKLDWVICGGESGSKARPMHPAWARSLSEQCKGAQVPFFFKQWGTWQPIQTFNGMQFLPMGDYDPVSKFGYKRKNKLLANDTLYGKQHHNWPFFQVKCKINSGACVYHACMDDGCQKHHMLQYGNHGLGDCEKSITI